MTGILSAFFGGNYGAKPNAPTVGTATVTGTTTATVTYTAPAFNGGVPITSYTATSSPGGITGTLSQAGSGTITVSGLTAGTAYTFSVTATNPIGTSASSGASNSITTYSVPANTVAPVVSGTATFGQTLSTTNGTWTGVPTPTYTYQWQRAGSNISGATGSTYQLVSADVGNAIRCVVTATNTAGSSSANSNATAAVVAAVPGAPQSVSASATGSTTATVSWSAPASNGGATITSYSIYWSGGSTSTGSTSVGITGLTASTSYTFTVYATNSAGTGSGAVSNSITTQQARGCQLYSTPGNYNWYVPAGVTNVSVVAVGAGSKFGGALAYVNSIPASNTSSGYFEVIVGAGAGGSYFPGEAGYSSFNQGGYYSTPGIRANGGREWNVNCRSATTLYNASGYSTSPVGNQGTYPGAGPGGGGGSYNSPASSYYAGGLQNAGEYGGGGGAGTSNYYKSSVNTYSPVTTIQANSGGAGGGGGSAIYGAYSSGSAGTTYFNPAGPVFTYFPMPGAGGGGAGYGGNARGNYSTVYSYYAYSGCTPNGGFPGGGAGTPAQGYILRCYYYCPCAGGCVPTASTSTFTSPFGYGGSGAVRIVWPGSSRQFPASDVAP